MAVDRGLLRRQPAQMKLIVHLIGCINLIRVVDGSISRIRRGQVAQHSTAAYTARHKVNAIHNLAGIAIHRTVPVEREGAACCAAQ